MVWLAADMLGERSERLITEVVMPGVAMMEQQADASAFLLEELNKFHKRSPEICAEQTTDTCGGTSGCS